MYNTILSGDEGDSLMTGRLLNFALTGLVIMLDDESTGDITAIGDLDDLSLSVTLKRDKNISIVDNCYLSNLIKVSEVKGGYLFDTSDDKHYLQVDLGKIILRGSDVLEVSINNSASFTDLQVECFAVNTQASSERVLAYEQLSAGGDNQTISDCVVIYNVESFSGNASINDGNNSIQIGSDQTFAIAEAIRDISSTVGITYIDARKIGQKLTATLPSADYIIEKRLS